MSVHFNINKIFETSLNGNVTYDSLLDYFITNYNKKIFVKKISDDLVIIYNKFNMKLHESNDINLYNECRSIIVQTGLNPKVISYTHDNIEYIKESNQSIIESELNTYEESFEGTLISVFNHLGKWFFCTSRCGSIDSSYFYDKNRTFGNLFDECLEKINISSREEFTDHLDTNICYYFVLVHHENKSIVSYTNRFGEEYKKLVHVFSREQSTQRMINAELKIDGIVIPQMFDTLQMGLDFISNNIESEGLLIKVLNEETSKSKFTKLHTDKYWLEKSHNPNYPNKWFAYLDIFKKDDVTFRIEDYQKEKNIIETLEINGKQIDITGMIYLLHKESAEIMFDIIMHFTQFNNSLHNFEKINLQDYENLKQTQYSVLRKQISVLQGLISKQILKSSGDIIKHLRKHITVEDFIGLLRCMKNLLKDKVTYIKNRNKNYILFLDMYLDNVK